MQGFKMVFKCLVSKGFLQLASGFMRRGIIGFTGEFLLFSQ
jgi:hypothetical protein